jgi:hypothetical protein
MKITKRTTGLAAGILLAAGLTAPVLAHHSTAAFDNTKVLKIEGTITQFRWTNPHASIKLDGEVEGAPNGLWTVEMTAPNVLINQGWTRTALRPGDKVVMYVNPLKNAIVLNDGSQGGLYVGVVLADGKKLGRTDGMGQGTDD